MMFTSLSYGILCVQIDFQINWIVEVNCEHMDITEKPHTG